jgi:hypothetical protein
MKAQILKIAGVKSEKEFYKKYPSEEAFMKVHGKAFKKAQFGTLIGGATPKQTVPKPMSFIDYQEYRDEADKIVTGKTQEEKDKEAYEQAMLAAAAKGGGGGGGGMGSLSSIMSMAGMAAGGGGGEALGGGTDSAMPDLAMSLGGGGRYGKRIRKAQDGDGVMDGIGNFPPPIDSSLEGSPGYQYQQAHDAPSGGGFMNSLSNIGQLAGKYAGPIGQIGEGLSMLKAGRQKKKEAQRMAKISDVAARASATREEESKRRYVRPEDISNTGEEFFPIYGVGTNVLTRNGGAVRRAQDGSFITGNPTEIQNTYSPEYDLYEDLGYEPLNDSNQVKSFYHGGRLYQMQDGGGTPWGAIGGMANNLGQSMMGGEDGGGKIGSTIGSTAGTLIGGPLGGAIGGFVGGVAGNLLDTNDRDTRKAEARTKNNVQRMALNSAFQGLNAQNNRYVRNGGDIDSYEDGGYMNPEYNPKVITMFGDHTAQDFADYAKKDQFRAGGHLKSYTPPSERAMETYAMGGQLKTHWGGKAETMSHNPYMPGSGETVVFRGQSHNESDKEGNTGIGITYGESPVEVERGEPMFEMQAGGEINPETGEAENTGVVFGNMPIDKKIAGQFDDPDLMEIANKYHGKKFKNVGIELAKQEAKQNKIIDKNAKMLDSFKVETSLDKAKFAAIQANMEGADSKLRNIANTKITLANYQNAINDAKEELSDAIGENLSAEDLARGYTKLDKDPVTKDAKWGGNIAKKAKDGITTTAETTLPPKTFKTKREAEAAGYKQNPTTKVWERVITKYNKDKTKVDKSATAMDNIPKQSIDKGTGFAGGVTKDKFEQFKKRFPDYPGIDKLDPKDPISLHDFKTWANNKAKEMGSSARILDDPKTKSNPQGLPIFGDQYLSFTVDESKKSEPDETKEVSTAVVDEPGETPMPEEKAKFPWQAIGNAILPYIRPTDQQGLDMAQLYPEMFAMATNQVEPVPAQSYQPELIVPYDISLQAQRNAVTSGQRALERQVGYNPAAQANLAPAAYNAINEINEKEFIANQGLKNQVYTGNVNTMNEAKKINLAIFADQWAKQSQALSNTKATTQAALNSIADKYAKNKLENRKLSIYENMYNYRFGKSGRAQNYNPLQFFDTSAGGSGSSDKSGGLAEGKEFTYDKYGNIVGVKSVDKNSVSDADLEAVGGIKDRNGGYTKIKSKNGSILRAFKNL